VPHVLVLHPPGGVVGGDRLEVAIDVGPRARALVTTPAAQKALPLGGARGAATQLLQARSRRRAGVAPGETIAFDGAVVRTATRVVLEHGSAFIGWEISCYGCPSSGVSFERGRLEQRFQIFRREQPLLIERTCVSGGAAVLAGPWGCAETRCWARCMPFRAMPAGSMAWWPVARTHELMLQDHACGHVAG
jgi:urease accessory protein